MITARQLARQDMARAAVLADRKPKRRKLVDEVNTCPLFLALCRKYWTKWEQEKMGKKVFVDSIVYRMSDESLGMNACDGAVFRAWAFRMIRERYDCSTAVHNNGSGSEVFINTPPDPLPQHKNAMTRMYNTAMDWLDTLPELYRAERL